MSSRTPNGECHSGLGDWLRILIPAVPQEVLLLYRNLIPNMGAKKACSKLFIQSLLRGGGWTRFPTAVSRLLPVTEVQSFASAVDIRSDQVV